MVSVNVMICILVGVMIGVRSPSCSARKRSCTSVGLSVSPILSVESYESVSESVLEVQSESYLDSASGYSASGFSSYRRANSRINVAVCGGVVGAVVYCCAISTGCMGLSILWLSSSVGSSVAVIGRMISANNVGKIDVTNVASGVAGVGGSARVAVPVVVAADRQLESCDRPCH